MIRRIFALAFCLQLVTHTTFADPAPKTAPANNSKPIALAKGPHLLLDDYLIAHSEGIERVVMQPQRFLKEPVVTSGPEHQNWQPWLTVQYDPARPQDKRFRMWYGAEIIDDPTDRPESIEGVVAYLESADGIHWPGPYQRLTSITARDPFCASVVDDGPHCRVPTERYKILYFDHGVMGPVVAFSPDGLQWAVQNGGQPILTDSIPDDSWHAAWDPLRKRYFLIGKQGGLHTWTNSEGNRVSRGIRMFGSSHSDDFKTWTEQKLIFSPDEKDPGVTEWYAAVGFMVRGDLIVGFLQGLRDDLTAEGAPKEAVECNFRNAGAGMGHTVLIWTRDGETWHRDRQKDAFLEPNPQVGAWDHAMAWIGSAAPVGDEVYLYYGGYRWGHKYQRMIDRQIGCVKVKRDRYVARRAGEQSGTITSPLAILEADTLALNVDAQQGQVRVQISDAAGKPVPGFTFADCQPIASDSLGAPVAWKTKSLKDVRGTPIRLEFEIQNASLFAFDLATGEKP
jgi:hypothetical protein